MKRVAIDLAEVVVRLRQLDGFGRHLGPIRSVAPLTTTADTIIRQRLMEDESKLHATP